MKLIVVGDIHGKTGEYRRLLNDIKGPSVQVGDMGLGFKGVGLPPPGTTPQAERHKFFRGNHDDPAKCRKHPRYMGDWGYDSETSIFHVAGAWSIDRDMRIEGISWWRDEELSYEELDRAITAYQIAKPRFVLSHDCPEKANNVLLYDLLGAYFLAKQECGKSRTCGALQAMLDIHAPEEWIFGHYHTDKTFYVPGYKTKFTCVAELSTYELEIGTNV